PKGDFRRRYFGGGNLKATVRRVEQIKKWKEAKLPEISMVELALLFTLSHPHTCTVIVGMKNRQQLESNLKVATMDLLVKDVLEELKQFAWPRDPWTEELE
ncbi:MAG TPA: aldo/keto reductase, partial [Candidatus Glassbacteria bacterium]|nr:aldo/keto reductase [Candidatus Glassbacteria bacterium]